MAFRPRSTFLVGLLRRYVPAQGRILDLGCNVGQNLDAVYGAGHGNLEAIEVNAAAVELLKQSYSEAKVAKMHVGTIEEFIRSLGPVECAFKMAIFVPAASGCAPKH